MTKFRVTICRPNPRGEICHTVEVEATDEENAKVAIQTYCLLNCIDFKKYEIENIEEVK